MAVRTLAEMKLDHRLQVVRGREGEREMKGGRKGGREGERVRHSTRPPHAFDTKFSLMCDCLTDLMQS